MRLGNLRAGLLTGCAAMAFLLVGTTSGTGAKAAEYFSRTATFEIINNGGARTDERVAEILDVSPDGNTVLYTDSEAAAIGFLGINDPYNPVGLGTIDLASALGSDNVEPTSLAVAKVKGSVYALVAVNTSPDLLNPSGTLAVFDVTGVNDGNGADDASEASLVTTFPLSGQPDSIAVSPRNNYAAVVIENERDEELCVGGEFDGFAIDEDLEEGTVDTAGKVIAEDVCEDPQSGTADGDVSQDGVAGVAGGLPQLPSGGLDVVKMSGKVTAWKVKPVDLSGLADIAGEDAEPEYVDIRRNNQAVVTLQENNHAVIVNLKKGKVVRHFPLGEVKLKNVDLTEEGVIRFEEDAVRLREPDAVTTLNYGQFATANEGDFEGGSRGFTIFDRRGKVKYESAESFDHMVARHGHYPEERSGNKGSEPEGIDSAYYGRDLFLFVGAERAGLIGVYKVKNTGRNKGKKAKVVFHQALPAGIGPEGLKTISKRKLFVVASEVDETPDEGRKAGFRSVISIYKLKKGKPNYPTLISADDKDVGVKGVPITWGAISSLAAHRKNPRIVYATSDSFYSESRIFKIKLKKRRPSVIVDYLPVDTSGVGDIALDLEGLVQSSDGTFWAASEGSGTQGDESRPFATSNKLLHIDRKGVVQEVVELPDTVTQRQRRWGFEGVAAVGKAGSEKLYAAIQRPWLANPSVDSSTEANPRIGVYDTATGEWKFFFYPTEATSGNPDLSNQWIGLSEIVYLGNDRFAVLERDNLVGEEAESDGFKQVCFISIEGIEPVADNGEANIDLPEVDKEACFDLIPAMASANGSVVDKVEGLTVTKWGKIIIATDNDGVDDHPGETLLLDVTKYVESAM